jgi:putative tryptophan/tyrosine transport system substrate-binding protein
MDGEMRRREFITFLGSVAAYPTAALADPPVTPVVGFLNSGSPAQFSHLVAAFKKGLNGAGLVEGRNVTVEYRWALGHYGRLSELAADLVQRQVAVIAASGGTSAALAAKAATTRIPIVFVGGGDPVDDGLVTSLNRPTANVTGMTVFSVILGAKRLELLREVVPSGTVVGMLVNPTGKTSEQAVVQAAADRVGQEVRMLKVSNDRELDAAFATIAGQRIGGLLVGGDPFFTSRREQLVLLTTRHGIPTVFPWREYVTGGGLLSYGTSLRHSYGEMADYVARILKGAKTSDLPVLQPSTFEIVVNLKAAKALGLTLPDSIMLRADEVIE